MKKSKVVELVKEALRGYSPQIGKTKGGTSNEFMQILTKIAKGEDEEYEGDAERGNTVLDKANPDNVARINRGEKPLYEGESIMNKSQLISYIKGLDNNTTLMVPTITPGGFAKGETSKMTVDSALKALSQTDKEGSFKVTQDRPTFKSFSLVISPEQLKKQTALVRSTGPLD